MSTLAVSHPALQELLDQLGPVAVMVGDAVPVRNHNDYSGLSPTSPMAVVRPADTAGVATALRICHAHGIGVVPQGGLTGLCGGARADANEIALSLERLVGIEEIDTAAATMTVAAGTPLETVQQAALNAGFFCPLDLGARGSCAIGGNLSTNAGGNRVIRYGMAREMVLGVEAVLADGTVVNCLNKMIKNNAGFDLKHLFIGSEGTLGVITRIVLRMFPKAGSSVVAMCACEDYAAVLRLLGAARSGLGPLLSAFEVMWPDYWDRAVNELRARNPFAGDDTRYGAYVLIEALGTDPESDLPRFESWMEKLLEEGVVPNAVVAQSLAEEQALWGVRDACGELHQTWPGHLAFDIGLPQTAMDDYARACKAELAEKVPGLESVFYGHIGDGNVHIVAYRAGDKVQPKDEVEEVVYGLVQKYGGTVSAEHGIGTIKRRWLGHARSPEQIALMRTLKNAMDPKGILNPGKVL
ncbi:MAG: FAD-binding oxidoreductase [Hydrogenophaga sp.]|jgi:FAD/FMN-containing dehydrogenase|uniref:FAD-binding oxidoreductase n=1 Tax=Hydrogenophaga sp. TaxID=1904254 RepID=UPI001D49D856|nr:FAD-binding oxidoreductase [Hydrogenophaga sp.]MBW0170468.1 FAD-binding oxidoreductase [Hydrogenophaga sp.]MBW0182777.1 FAD-binding oxidoreductase [Hydrogenophaga sp.]